MTDYPEPDQQGEQMGATVQAPVVVGYEYQFHCTECTTLGTVVTTEGEAQSEGHAHQISYHPPAATYTVQAIPKYT